MAWLGTWANRVKLTLDHDQIDSALSNFPVLLYLSAASGVGDVDVSCVFDELTSDANRKKIAVTTSDGETQCYVEIERWDDANEKAWLHVKVPSVSDSADTVLYLYYDSAQADNTSYVGDTTDAVTHNVWDSNFVAVYHMAQDPNGDAADAIKDSTSNGNDLTPNGSMTTADLVDGPASKAIEFDGTDDYLNLLDDAAFDLGLSDYTVESILKASTIPNYARIMSCGKTGAIWRPLYYYDGRPDMYLENADYKTYTDPRHNDGVFHHVVWSADRSGYATCYDDGEVYYSPKDISAKSGFSLDSEGIGIGGDVTGGNYWNGVIGEVRLSSTARSAPWIKATYHSLWDSLVTFGSEEVGSTEVSATCASLTITANAATISYDISISATCASLTISAHNIVVFYGQLVSAACASLTITPNAATISYDINVSAIAASLTITTFRASVNLIEVLATSASLTIAPQAARVKLNVPVSASLAVLSIASSSAIISNDIEVEAIAASLTIAASSATVKYDVQVNPSVVALTITPNAVTISYDIEIEAGSQALTVATYDAEIWDGAAWSAWLLENYTKTVRRYEFTLTGDADGLDDVIIPIISFQCRRRDSAPTYLSVVIKDMTYSDSITARSNGDMIIEMIYDLYGVEVYRNALAEVHLEDIRIDEGPLNSAISLTGYQQHSYTPKSLTMQDLVYKQYKNGEYRYRCSIPNLYLNPGDTVIDDDVSFVSDEIQYIVNVEQQSMEVRGV